MGKEKVYGVWAVRSGSSIFGRAEGWCKEDGKPLEFDSEKAAQDYADEAGRHATANVRSTEQQDHRQCPLLYTGEGTRTGRRQKDFRTGTAGFGCPRP